MSDATIEATGTLPRRRRIRRILHWVIAALVLFTIPLGLVFTDFDNKEWAEATFGEGAFDTLYDLHKSIGVTVLALMIVRIWAWRRWPDPPYARPLPEKVHRAAWLSHRTFYVLLVVVPLLGWAGVSAYPAPIPVFGLFEAPHIVGEDRALSERLLDFHRVFALAVAALAIVHIGAAIWHWRWRRDGVMERIALRPPN